ncbi:extracellular solute-binding protein [Companilactobacillus nantensis]|uniref:ABC transporter n=1 Tax=Companilactobacillus nantensis DSM 16982 TaxID=1423774 RepID=A0A0R1WU93_9LACO|nr:extracellular solute-binding protein [Companilactobacillus nantensis]KRM18643.1 ABC transporter [Companilactobacillus nantensis DSM 16982]GEO63170.1 ABC transporter substrate-binding protein [Companilactobacillus nantensis]
MKNIFKIFFISVLFLGVLTGCGAKKSSQSASKDATKNEKIVVYSNSVSNGRGDFLKEESHKKGFKLEVVDLGGNDLFNRLIAEKDAPVADVTFGMNQMMFTTLKQKGMLSTYSPKWLSNVDKNLIDKDNKFAPLSEQRVFMIYNSEKIKKDKAIKSWKNLYTTSNLKHKYIVPTNLGGATANAVVYTQLMNHKDKHGKLGISNKGWNELDKFFKNGAILSEGQTEVAALANGDVDYSYTFLSNIPVVEQKLGVKLGVVNPPYGVPQTVEQVGILKKKHVSASAKKFVDWLGTAEFQGKWAKKFGTAPVNKDAQSSMNERVREVMKETTPQKLDYEFVNDHTAKWAENIELNILK